VDESLECAFVRAKAIGLIEAVHTQPAEGTSAVAIQDKCVEERRPARQAEKIGRQRFRAVQAGGANWNARNLAERSSANAAVVRKEIGEGRRKESGRGPDRFDPAGPREYWL
jgi:hypothetical protein